eukprot:COSAG01_NODE_18776_length_1053_cov_24.685535_1_plen_142_part_10
MAVAYLVQGMVYFSHLLLTHPASTPVCRRRRLGVGGITTPISMHQHVIRRALKVAPVAFQRSTAHGLTRSGEHLQLLHLLCGHPHWHACTWRGRRGWPSTRWRQPYGATIPSLRIDLPIVSQVDVVRMAPSWAQVDPHRIGT